MSLNFAGSSSSAAQPLWQTQMDSGFERSSRVLMISKLASGSIESFHRAVEMDEELTQRDRRLHHAELTNWKNSFVSFLSYDILQALNGAAAVNREELKSALVWFYFYGGGSQLNVLVWTGVIAEAFTKWDRALDLTCRESQVSPQQVLQKSLSRRSTMGRPASLPPCYEAVVGLTPPLQTPSPSTSSPTSRIGPNIAPTRRRMDVLAEYHEGSDTFGPPTATAPPPAASRQRFEAVSPFQEVARTRMQTILPEVVPRTPTPGRGSGFFSNLLRNIGNLMGGLSSSGGHTPDIDISSEFDFLRPTPFETGHSSSPLLGSHAQRLEKLAMPKYWREALSPVLQASGGVRRFKPKQSDVRFQYLADDGSGDQLSVGFSLSDIVLTEGGKRTLVKGNGVDLATTVASHCEGYINAR